MAFWALTGGTAAAKAPAVVASIVPVHSLVAGVMEGIGRPNLLVRGGGSPHAYTLRPSEAAALQRAEVVFWIGEELETFLQRPLASVAAGARVVALCAAEGITLLPYRAGGDWGGQTAELSGDHEHALGETDLHLWLDPVNARAMAARIAAVLSEADPADASRYRANAAELDRRLAELDAVLDRDLAPLRGRPYVVFHDAYQYFERRYGLTAVGAIAVGADRQPGAGTLAEIRRTIVETGVRCVFAEPQFEPALVHTVIGGTGARTGVLDPLGAELEPGPDAYFRLLRNLATAIAGCLAPPD
jgi:zinc transport system substrate-binding protein